MKYPEKFIVAELIKMDLDELRALSDALWEDWRRVDMALKVVSEMDKQTKEASEE
jgi:hypothetical protein